MVERPMSMDEVFGGSLPHQMMILQGSDTRQALQN